MADPTFNPMARFERAKSKAKQETTAQTQEAKDALARRFASMGLQSSGAAIKTESQVQQKGNEALQGRLEGIQGQQEQEQQRVGEIKESRDFAKSEREAGQAFGAGQAEIQRKFASDEARFGRDFAMQQMEKAQKFAQSERGASQKYATSERMAGQSFSQEMTDKQQQFQRDYVLGPQAEQWQKQYDLALEQFGMDQMVTNFNMKQSKSEAGKKDFFGRLGDMGTSIWRTSTLQQVGGYSTPFDWRKW